MSEREEPLPTKIDRYEPLKKLATGGMAEIFLAKQSGLEGFEKVVVLKRILSHLASDEEFVSMFLDEARIAAKLSHPNIVQIYDLGKADNTYYIAMEYVSGRNVQHLINKQQGQGGHLPVEHVCRIIAGVCDGLFYAHSRKDYDGKPLNIVHRDISPQNILVSFAGGVKVVDFGIAKASTQLAQTRAGVLKGKYAYMSPEQVRGAKVDHRSDLFAVGLVMYEMLTGMRAFERDTSLKTLKAIVQEKPLNPREANPEIPMDVVKLLSKALEKNPDRRYKTAQEMQLALEDFLEQSPKKSNNVRLSRFLYELFDDELNSAEGTLVVKGVGQVIIPTSQGAAPAKPAFEEEVDSKTLTAALVDDVPQQPPTQNSKPQAASSGRVRDELSKPMAAQTPKPTPPKQAKTPARAAPPEPEDRPSDSMLGDDEDNDGKTMPGYDLEQLERDRVAMMAKKGIAPMTAEEDDGEDKTRAGVPMSASAPSMPPSLPPQPAARATPPPPAPRQRPPDDSDARARAMLEKVESMAAGAGSLPDEMPRGSLPDGAPQWQASTKETLKSSNSGDEMIIGSGGQVGGRAPINTSQPNRAMPGLADLDISADDLDDDAGPSPPTLPATMPAHLEHSQSQVVPVVTAAVRPPAFFAAIGASAGMAAVALILVVFGAVVLTPAAPPVEYGVVMVTSSPPGAAVIFESAPTVTPGQFVVPLDGVERTVEVQLHGFATKEQKLVFAPGSNVLPLSIALDPQG
ncbi:MAG: protein kinase [Deltaproteobacteria bacterium]|nr:protein kinase [Deltaproteobacteria bacterium]